MTNRVIVVATGQKGAAGPAGGVDSVNGQTGDVILDLGGDVDSVNGETGDVILDADDVGADPEGTAAGLIGALVAFDVGAEPVGATANHNATTLNVHGIPNTALLLDTADIGVTVAPYSPINLATLLDYTDIGVLVQPYSATDMATQAELDAHTADTTGIHGITDTTLLLTTSSKLDDLATPDDNTDLNASTARHGLLPKLSGVGTEFLNGSGTFAVPSGGPGGGGDLLAANNLSDVVNAATARTNLGLQIGVNVAAYSATDMATQAELDAHAADTTAIHGIANTALLLTAVAVPSNITATGTPSSTTYLRGDGTWNVPPGGSGGIDGGGF